MRRMRHLISVDVDRTKKALKNCSGKRTLVRSRVPPGMVLPRGRDGSMRRMRHLISVDAVVSQWQARTGQE